MIHHVLSTAAESLAQPPAAPTPSSTHTPKANGASPAAPPTKGGKASSAKPESTTKKDEKDEEEKERKEPLKPRVESVYLHVQVGNDEAKRFWEKWGFEVKVREAPSVSFVSPRAFLADLASPISSSFDCPPATPIPYLHRHEQETVTDYYRKISPRDAWLLERKLAPAATSS